MAASTFVASGNYTTPSGGNATGVVEFTAANLREVNTSTIQDASLVTATLTNGAIAQTLVVNVGGYNVTEKITNSQPVSYVIPGVANINLSTIDAGSAQFDASGVVNVVAPETVSGTVYTFDVTDGANVVKQFTAGTAVTATVDGSAVIPVGTTILWMQQGVGKVTFVGTNGATLHGVGGALASQGQFASGSLRKYTSTLWLLSGEIGA